MSLYNGPARGGNRGGKDQFNWESVKSDKDREFYLGHSVKATTGRWQKGKAADICRVVLCMYIFVKLLRSDAGKDVFWYTREKEQEQAEKARLELQAIKQREEDLMNEVSAEQASLLRSHLYLSFSDDAEARLCYIFSLCRH